jgi:hypothetical protein
MAKPAAAAAAAQLHSFPELLRGDASRFVAHLEQEIRTKGTPTKEKELQKLVVALLKRLHPQWDVLEEQDVPVPTVRNRNRKGNYDVLIRHEGKSCVLELKYIQARFYRAADRTRGRRNLNLDDHVRAKRVGDDTLADMGADALRDCWVQLANHVPPEVTLGIKNGEKAVPEEAREELLVCCHMRGQQCVDLMDTATVPPPLMPLKPEKRDGRTWTPFVYNTDIHCVVASALEQAKMYQRNITPRPQAAVALVGFGPRVIVGEERAKEEKKKEERAPEKQGPLQTISDLADVLDDDFANDDEDPDDDDFADDTEESAESEEEDSE